MIIKSGGFQWSFNSSFATNRAPDSVTCNNWELTTFDAWSVCSSDTKPGIYGISETSSPSYLKNSDCPTKARMRVSCLVLAGRQDRDQRPLEVDWCVLVKTDTVSNNSKTSAVSNARDRNELTLTLFFEVDDGHVFDRTEVIVLRQFCQIISVFGFVRLNSH